MPLFSSSIRWRLQLWMAFLLTLLVGGFGVTIFELQRITQRNELDNELATRVAGLNLAVRGGPPADPNHRFRERIWDGKPGPGFPPPPPREPLGEPPPGQPFPGRPNRVLVLSEELSALFANQGTTDFYYGVWSRDGRDMGRSKNIPLDLQFPQRPGRDTSVQLRERDHVREAYQFTELGDCILVGRSMEPLLQIQRRLAWITSAAGAGILILGLGGSWILVSRSIRPIENISQAAIRISAGNLSERIPNPEPENELGKLASVLNGAFARLEATFNQQKQFTADASHELRTPIAVIISESQTALARERNAQDYKDTIQANLNAAQEMRRLTDSLLTLARLDSQQDSIGNTECDLGRITQECLDLLAPLIEANHLKLEHQLRSAPAFGDPERLRQVVSNLLSNAIYYNKPGGNIRILTEQQGTQSLLSVSDTGIGIAKEDLDQVFTRFYRVDSSRSHAEGRTGLGLAIAQSIVQAHGGHITVTSEVGRGSTFSVWLPSADPSSKMSTS